MQAFIELVEKAAVCERVGSRNYSEKLFHILNMSLCVRVWQREREGGRLK